MGDVIGEVDENIIKLQNKIWEPIVWNSPPSCKIIDLQETHYEEVLRLIKRHYFSEDPLWKNDYQNDQESVRDHLSCIEIWMKDTTSLVALSATTGRAVGAIIVRIRSFQDKLDTFDRILDYRGWLHNEIMRLTNTLVKEAKAFEALECEEYLRIYMLCVHPSYKDKEIERALLAAVIQNALVLKMRAIAGIFTSEGHQELARGYGFQLLREIRYSRWISNDVVTFDDPGQGNYSAALMALRLSENSEDQQCDTDEDDGGDQRKEERKD